MKKFTLTALAVVAAALSSAAQAEIKVAVAGPMTGQYASFGEQMKIGAEAAVADINAAGGVMGQKLVLSVGDDACDAKQAVSVANRLAGDGVVFVAGHFCSGSSIPASSVYTEEGVVQISPASTNPKFTDERPDPAGGTYRVCGRDDQQGGVAGAYLQATFPDKKVAFVHDKTAYGKGLADETKKAYEAAGGKAAMYEAITAGEKDYSAIVTKMKSAGIDIVYLGGYHTEGGLIVRQMRDQGMETILVGGDALVTSEYWAITGEAGAGTLMTFSPDPRKNPNAQTLVKKLEAEGKTTEGYVVYSYAAIQAWAQAVETAGSTDYAKVSKALNDGAFKTALGEFSFDDKGDVSLTGYVVYEWKDGQYAEIQ